MAPSSGLIRSAVAMALLLGAHAPAAAVDWPANGAPVCNAPGDQLGILHRAGFCSGMQLWWHDQLSDSLRPGFVSAEPPDGTCQPTYQPGVPAPGARDGATTLGFNGLIALVGCIDRTPCHVWIEGTD